MNDDSAKCRKLTALAIKSLLGRIDNNDRTSLFSIVLKWLMDEKVCVIINPLLPRLFLDHDIILYF